MSSLIPEMSLTEFRKLKEPDIRQLKSYEITYDGEHLCTIIIPPVEGGITITDSIKTRAEQVAYSGNSVGGKTVEEIREANHAGGD